MRNALLLIAGFLLITAHPRRTQIQSFDLLIRNGTIYDGSGNRPFTGDIGINADTIVVIGDLKEATGKEEVDATGLAVSPGFINMLSWGDASLLMDGRGMGDIKQGVTLEIFGEGWSPAPVKRNAPRVDSLWSTLDDYFKWMMKKGVSPNVASFVGATTIRVYHLGYQKRAPTPQELERMKKLVREAMEDGALGLGSSLIYAPAEFASTEELIALAKVASEYGGLYITHMRSESDHILKALNETFRIAKEAHIPTEIYHLKINHERNWNKIDTVLAKIDSAQKAGLSITANMYPYTSSATGLVSRLPTWAQEGGAKAMRKRLRNPAIRKKVLNEMRLGIPSKNSDPKDVMIIGFRLDSLNHLYRGKRLDEIARLHGKNADETTLDLIIKDRSPISAIYFLMREENVKRIARLPYVSVGSDAPAMSTEKTFEDWGAHPRTFGTFARFLNKYVQQDSLFKLEEGIRRMTSLPAGTLKINKRGSLKTGYYADIVLFNAALFQDHATFDNPFQYASGMQHVFINGIHVLRNGEHTGKKPGRVVRGSGFKAKN